MRVTHFEISSPKCFAPFSPIRFSLRSKFKEVRVTHFEIPSPKYFAPFSPFSSILFQVLFKLIEYIN